MFGILNKRTVAVISALALAVSSAVAYAEDAFEETASYILETVPNPSVGVTGGEWAVIGLARGGMDINDDYFRKYYENAVRYASEKQGVLDSRKSTENSRVILALTAIGRDPRNVGEYNLLMPLADYSAVTAQGLNGAVYALLALDCGGYDMPENPGAEVQASREMYVDEILKAQLMNGAFELAPGAGADVDITAMTLCALCAYTDGLEAKTAADMALEYLSSVQEADGGFSAGGRENCESAAQVLTALSSMGIDERDERFVKNGHSVKDNLLSYAAEDGGFSHEKGMEVDPMATEQAFYALAADRRAAGGKTRLFDMSDVSRADIPDESTADGLPGKNPDVRKMPVISSGIRFGDVSISKAEIEALASRGIINGRAENSFAPDDSLTRAELAAIMVRGLGLPVKAGSGFSDVGEDDWFFEYVSTAAAYGIVNGVSESEFDPYGTITRAQAAVMTARAAGLCGLDTEMSADGIRDELAQFGDYMSVPEWADAQTAFCYASGILPQEDMEIKPMRAITRREAAAALYNLLERAELL